MCTMSEIINWTTAANSHEYSQFSHSYVDSTVFFDGAKLYDSYMEM